MRRSRNRRSPLARVARLALLALAALVVVTVPLLAVAPAQAHDELLKATPANGATVTQPPTEVVLQFSDVVLASGSAVVVTAPDGTAVAQGPASIAGPVVRQPLAPVTVAGTYTVAYRVVSADGHPVSQTLTFRYAPTATAAPPDTASSTSTSAPAGATPTPSPSVATSASDIASASPTAAASASPAAASGSGGGSTGAVVAVTVVALVAVAGLVGWLLTRRRRSGTPGG